MNPYPDLYGMIPHWTEPYLPRPDERNEVEATSYQPKLLPEWYDQGPVMAKRVGDISYEVWVNGTFTTTSPNGDRFKGSDSAYDWLRERNITDDRGLEAVLRSEGGWYTHVNKWFELIVFRIVSRNGVDHLCEMYNGDEIYDRFDAEVFVDMINDAIASDAQEVEA